MSNSPSTIIAALNDIALHGPPAKIASDVRPYFTDDAIIVGPDLKRAARGGDAVAASYAEFREAADILDVWIGDPEVDESSSVATATLPWEMHYLCEGVEATECGDDIYVLRREGDDWKICWRAIHARPIES